MQWEVAQEIDLEGYEIQFSINGIDFEVLGFVSAQALHRYQFISPALNLSQKYYRLKMLDLDGSFTFSPIRSLAATENQFRLASTLIVDVLEFTEPLVYPSRIANQHGHIIRLLGLNTMAQDVQDLASGIYFLQSKYQTLKFVKL